MHRCTVLQCDRKPENNNIRSIKRFGRWHYSRNSMCTRWCSIISFTETYFKVGHSKCTEALQRWIDTIKFELLIRYHHTHAVRISMQKKCIEHKKYFPENWSRRHFNDFHTFEHAFNNIYLFFFYHYNC